MVSNDQQGISIQQVGFSDIHIDPQTEICNFLLGHYFQNYLGENAENQDSDNISKIQKDPMVE